MMLTIASEAVEELGFKLRSARAVIVSYTIVRLSIRGNSVGSQFDDEEGLAIVVKQG